MVVVFPGPVGAQQAENLAFLHGKTRAAQRLHGAVVLVEVLDLNDGFAHGLNP